MHMNTLNDSNDFTIAVISSPQLSDPSSVEQLSNHCVFAFEAKPSLAEEFSTSTDLDGRLLQSTPSPVYNSVIVLWDSLP